MRARTLGILIGLAVSAAVFGAAEAPWREWYGKATEAERTGNDAGLLDALLHLHDLLSANPRTLLKLARVEARLGHANKAITYLDSLARAGLSVDLQGDKDLRGISGLLPIGEHMERNRRPVQNGESFATVADADLLLEDLAWDPGTASFYGGSVRQRKIVRIDAKGAVRDFLAYPQADLWGVFAVRVDNAHRILWAATGAIPHQTNYDPRDKGKTAVLQIDLSSGRVVHRSDVKAPGEEHLFGDMTLDGAGNAYIADSSGALYLLARGTENLERWDNGSEFVSPQTPAISADGKTLYVPDYLRGIAWIDLMERAAKTHSIHWVEHPDSVALAGIDGLYVDGQSLLAIQNGTEPERVVRFPLSADGKRVDSYQVIESGTPGFGDPTHGVIRGRDFLYIVNSGWDRYTDEGKPKAGVTATPPAIHRFRL